MNTLWWRALTIALLVVLTGVFLPAAGIAQCPPPYPTSPLAEGEVGLFFDPLGTQTCADIVLGILTPLYVVARVPEGGVAQFEIPEVLTEALPPGLIIVTPGSLPPGIPYDPLIVLDGCNGARRTDPATCPVSQGDLLPISMVEVMAVSPLGGTACFQTACPTFAEVVPKAPVYFRCDGGDPIAFTGWDSMCIGFGEPPVPVEASTWGAIKSLYNN